MNLIPCRRGTFIKTDVHQSNVAVQHVCFTELCAQYEHTRLITTYDHVNYTVSMLQFCVAVFCLFAVPFLR